MTIKAEDEAVKYTEKYYAETEAVDASKRVEYEKKKFFLRSDIARRHEDVRCGMQTPLWNWRGSNDSTLGRAWVRVNHGDYERGRRDRGGCGYRLWRSR